MSIINKLRSHLSSLKLQKTKKPRDLTERQEFLEIYKLLRAEHPSVRGLKTFVETGTFQGENIRKLEPYFDILYTIEIDPKLHAEAKARHPSVKIRYVLGDSSVELRKISKEIQQPALFYLDAHFSGEGTGRGSKDVPLIEEMEILGKRNHPDCIIVDDLRLFGTHRNQEDWSAVTRNSILQAFGAQDLQFFEQGDKLILLRSPESHPGHPKYL
jgi:hypothetical protein